MIVFLFCFVFKTYRIQPTENECVNTFFCVLFGQKTLGPNNVFGQTWSNSFYMVVKFQVSKIILKFLAWFVTISDMESRFRAPSLDLSLLRPKTITSVLSALSWRNSLICFIHLLSECKVCGYGDLLILHIHFFTFCLICLQSLQIAAFLFTVCHAVIVVQDWFTDINLYR